MTNEDFDKVVALGPGPGQKYPTDWKATSLEPLPIPSFVPCFNAKFEIFVMLSKRELEVNIEECDRVLPLLARYPEENARTISLYQATKEDAIALIKEYFS